MCLADPKPVKRDRAIGWKVLVITPHGLVPPWHAATGPLRPGQWHTARDMAPDRAHVSSPGPVREYKPGFHAFVTLRDAVRNYRRGWSDSGGLAVVKVALKDIHTTGLDFSGVEVSDFGKWVPCLVAKRQCILKIYQHWEIAHIKV